MDFGLAVHVRDVISMCNAFLELFKNPACNVVETNPDLKLRVKFNDVGCDSV